MPSTGKSWHVEITLSAKEHQKAVRSVSVFQNNWRAIQIISRTAEFIPIARWHVYVLFQNQLKQN